MADKKLNEVTTVSTGTLNNVKNFLAVMNDGSIQQMSKEDMAEVVGELLGINNTYFKDRGQIKNSQLNDTLNTGAYFVLEESGVELANGLLLVFTSSFITYQEFFNFSNSLRKSRIKWGTVWREWKDI